MEAAQNCRPFPPLPHPWTLNSQAKVFWLMFLAFRSDVGELCTQGTVWKI